MGKKTDTFVGPPVQIGADVFTRLCMPIVREATRKANPTRQHMGQLYAGFIGACVGAMIADVGKEQALAWARETLVMGAPADFGKCPKCDTTSEADEWVEAEDDSAGVGGRDGS